MADKERSGKKDGEKKGKERDDEKEQNFLEDWQDLNQNPPSVGPIKKKDAAGKEKARER
jgi:hypothetical protein